MAAPIAASSPSAFSVAERTRRIAAVRDALDAFGLDALVAVSTSYLPGPVAYLTGYMTVFSPAFCVVTAESCDLVTVPWEYAHTRGETWLEPERIHRGAEPAALVKRLLDAAGPRVGVAGFDQLAAADARALGEGLAPTPLLDRIRAIKSDEELACMRRAARVVDLGIEAFAAGVEAGGLTEIELASAIEAALRDAGHDRTPVIILGSGPRSLDCTPQPRDIPIRDGDFVMYDGLARVDGYCSDTCRTMVAGGEPSAPQLALLELVEQIYERLCAAARPGVDGRDIHALGVELAREAGHDYGELYDYSGHNVGTDFHEPAPFLGAGEQPVVLEAGMVVTIEPGIYARELGGVRFENTHLVTADGLVSLNNAPIRLW